jgi:methylthioribulose-1-phosphate dehydratase
MSTGPSLSHLSAETELPPLDGLSLRAHVAELAHFLHAQGWTPATSSNFSCRTDSDAPGFSISISGLDKGQLTPEDFLDVDYDGNVLDSSQPHVRPSAETLLHSVVYRHYPHTAVVLHTHSVNGTVLSKLYEAQHGVCLKDFEILKAFEGVKTHQTEVWLPIFPNSQDMHALSAEVAAELSTHRPVYGFLLAGHGLYTWGKTPAQAKRHVEAFETLFECILKLRSYGYPEYSR